MVKPIKNLSIFFLVLLLATFMLIPQIIYAGTLTTLSDVLTRLKTDTASSHDITFTLDGSTALDSTETITVDFHEDDSDFVVAGAASAISDFGFHDGTERTIVGVDGDCTGHSGVNDVAVDIDDTTGVVTFEACGTFTSSASGATVNIEYGTSAGGTNRVTNPSVADTYVLDIAGSVNDDGKIAIVIITDDQVIMSASVDPSITFSVSATSSAFGTLDSSSVITSSPNISLVVGTNADTGYTITVQDAGDTSNPGLYNSTASYMIGSADYSYNNSADLSSVAGYGIQGASGDATIAATYDQSSDNVGGLELTATTLASCGTNLTSNHTVTVTHKAKVTSWTPAGSYSDTITYIATGNF